MVRRAGLAIIAIYLRGRGLMQGFIVLEMTMVQSLYLMAYVPFSVDLKQRLELFNELCLITIACQVMSITTIPVEFLEGDPLMLGYLFQVVIAINVSVHFFFLFKGMFVGMKLRYKKRQAIKEAKRKKEEKAKDKVETPGKSPLEGTPKQNQVS